MENLIKYLSYLVARHNCVIIPGVGAFLASEVSARYNAEERIFMPPSRTMRFNPDVTIDDALLVSEYISREQLSHAEADKQMKKDIATLRDALVQESAVRMGELGMFRMNIKGEITFETDINGIEDPANFGFEPIAIATLRDCEEKKIVIRHRDLGKFVAAAAAIILTFIFVTPMNDSAYKQNLQASFTGFASNEQISLMQQVSTPAPALIDNEIENCEISPLDANGNMNILLIEETASETAVLNEEQTSAEAPVAQPVQSRKVFHVIVASSPNEENARLAIEELSAKKAADYFIVKGGGRHRISIGEFTSNNEATAAVEELKATFPDAWILQTNSME